VARKYYKNLNVLSTISVVVVVGADFSVKDTSCAFEIRSFICQAVKLAKEQLRSRRFCPKAGTDGAESIA